MLGRNEIDRKVRNLAPVATNTGRRIAIWIYSLAALLIFLSTASLTLIAHMAWNKADKHALQSEQLRMTDMLNDIRRQIARNQISLAQWDKAFAAIQPPIDQGFIETEFIEGLREDFGLERTFIISTDGSTIAQATGTEIRYGDDKAPQDEVMSRLATETLEVFRQKQRESGSVFADWYMPQSYLMEISSSAFAMIDGIPVLLNSMPILPDEGRVTLPPDYPFILINAVYIDASWLDRLQEQLGFNDLRFHTGEPEKPHPTNYLLASADQTTFGYFRWDNAMPGRDIWYTAIPLIILFAAIIASVAFAAASKISRLSASLEESERKHHHFARHDALTGLPNRHHFFDCLAFCLDDLPERSFAILACDLDRFKPVNDTFGHEAGDRVLCVIADRLSKLVGTNGVASRIGGDEFLILLTKYEDRGSLEDLARRIMSEIASPVEVSGVQKVEIGVSIGIAIAPDCGTDEKDLIRMADLALYRAKEKGRNAFEFASPRKTETKTDHVSAAQ